MILYIDRGGTSTKVWFHPMRSSKTISFPSDIPLLRGRLKIFLSRLSKKPSRAIVGSRGVWTKKERADFKNKFTFLAPQVTVLSDIELLHDLALSHQPGITLNAGTGSMAFGRNKGGKTARAGGLGPLMGDEGSAFWIGREYLKSKKSVAYLRQLIRHENGVKKIASHARAVLKNNSLFCKKIREDALTHLALLVTQVQHRLKIKKPIPLVLRGGLFKNKRFRREFLKRVPQFKPVA